MGDLGYDGVPFCKTRKRENSRAHCWRVRVGQWQADGRPEVAGTYVSCGPCGVDFTEDGKGEGAGKVGSGGSVRLCRLHGIC